MGTLSFRFKDFVEKIYSLPLEDKMELKNLLELNISDARRNEIAKNYSEAKEEYKSGKLQFSSDLDALKSMLSNPRETKTVASTSYSIVPLI